MGSKKKPFTQKDLFKVANERGFLITPEEFGPIIHRKSCAGTRKIEWTKRAPNPAAQTSFDESGPLAKFRGIINETIIQNGYDAATLEEATIAMDLASTFYRRVTNGIMDAIL